MGNARLPKVLEAVADAYRKSGARRSRRTRGKFALVAPRGDRPAQARTTVPSDDPRRGGRALARSFDARNGGFGGAPKFPQPAALEFSAAQPPPAYRRPARRSWRSGRSTRWPRRHLRPARRRLPPLRRRRHLAGAALREDALRQRPARSRSTWPGLPGVRRRALPPRREETLEYVAREMTDAGGGFYSTQDADTGRARGAQFYVWTARSRRGARRGRRRGRRAWFNVDAGGNFEGRTVLAKPRDGRDRGGALASPKRLWRLARANQATLLRSRAKRSGRAATRRSSRLERADAQGVRRRLAHPGPADFARWPSATRIPARASAA